MRAAKCQTREISWVDELFTAYQRSRVIKVVSDACERAGSLNAREMTVIDAGCFDGRLYWYMEQNHLYPRYVGLDVREDYLEEARRKVPPGRATFLPMDLSQEPVGTHWVFPGQPDDLLLGDVVVCLEVLEHLDGDAAVRTLENLFHLAKPDGLVVVGTPVNTRGATFHRLDAEQNLGHVNFLVHEDLLALVAAWGHDLVEASPGWSLKSTYRIPRDLPEPWVTMKRRLGNAFRAAYLSCMTEPNGGGFYVWRKRA